MSYTPISELPKIHEELNKTFKSQRTRPLQWRKQQLLQLAKMVKENHTRFYEAIHEDLGKPELEIYQSEIGTSIERSIMHFNKVDEWAAPVDKTAEVPDFQKAWGVKVYKEPKGVALIISPWNYPMILSLQPLMGAIAAGCCAVIKPSEIAGAYAAVLQELVPKYLDQSAYRVVCGGAEETTKLLELKWDHIFYTGNGVIGRIISTAAAKHLTPVTLELGGKSPVIIDPNYPDLEVAARRILYGKSCNAGQICVTPDYVLLPKPSLLTPFLNAVSKVYNEFFGPENPGLTSSSFGKLISDNHFNRVSSLISRTKGQIVHGGNSDPKTRKMELTVVVLDPKDVEGGLQGIENDSLMLGENFGPVLPIVVLPETEGGLEGAIQFVRRRDHPLVLYAFTEDEKAKEKVREGTLSGALVFNDTFMQLAVSAIPFGGVGESGHGRQVLEYSFDEFSYERSSITMPLAAEPMLKMRYPPYGEQQTKFFKAVIDRPLPELPPV